MPSTRRFAPASVVRKTRDTLLATVDSAGLNRFALQTQWRQRQLLILCYHGCSIDDEHLWDGNLYVSPAHLQRRLELIREAGCHVLTLSDAFARLKSGSLPPRSVVLTFDDGNHDFYAKAFPILRDYGFPATVYLQTAYSEFQRPVFNVTARYLLWKAQSQTLSVPEVFGRQTYDLSEDGQRQQCSAEIIEFARSQHLSLAERDRLLIHLSRQLNVSLDSILHRRMFHTMSLSEARELAVQGVDFQLHTHSHVVWDQERRFLREVSENRSRVESFAGSAVHFCYPNGSCLDSFPKWLESAGVITATTCQPGMATRATDPYRLPRLCDSSTLTEASFRSWLSGLAGLLPRRTVPCSMVDVMTAPEALPVTPVLEGRRQFTD